MHAMEILHGTLARGCPRLHKRRLDALMKAVAAALHARNHTLSNLARALGGSTSVGQRVKCFDRLLGNGALQRWGGASTRPWPPTCWPVAPNQSSSFTGAIRKPIAPRR